MRIRLDITRRKNAESPSYVLSTFFDAQHSDTVASALNCINADSGRKDINGRSFSEIRFECSCLQKKCGACAMVICGSHYDIRTDLSVFFSNAGEVVERIREAMLKNRSVSISYTSHENNMSDIEAVAADLMNCVYAETDDPREGDYLRCRCSGYEINYSYTEDSGSFEYTVNITPSYITSLKQESLVDEAVKDITSVLGGSEYSRVRAVYEYLKNTVRYDRTAAKSVSNKLKSSAYAAIVQHTAACRGYSAAAYRLLRECGIAARVVTGAVMLPDGSTENHSWNIVCIDGSWYNMDITWDDQLESEDYFLKADSDMPDHRSDKEIYPISKESYK